MSSGTNGTEPKRRGRRRSGADTKAALLAAAREVFTEQGYDAATVRAIAAQAGVDPAMVNHWFGGKAGLFSAAVHIPVNPAEVVPQLLAGDREQLAERLLRRFLTVWDNAEGGQFAALVRSIATNENAVAMLREFIQNVMFEKLIKALDVDQPDLRGALCGSQIVGLGMARYVVRLEPLASADHDTVVAAVGPNLQRYLTGALD
ncbi:transcriptional regulator, TetR family [Saccharopolyspora kobensis]|uniref:Transcriptional regulator, TetR family n=1 Tax=Saccharopolyspora kobensis TaxID=146035 RepID=A0A1H6C319_9PSEU|nr:TetR/AcrR family transcriptional regulator [Saccharopolyspora kobensis]SEG67338.1 transcriptional regulator, TetR family [Saccharopolyspora kobensis]SFC25677.1 transcriptional regulator, TetR family [Saccharopolyspora kobensis]